MVNIYECIEDFMASLVVGGRYSRSRLASSFMQMSYISQTMQLPSYCVTNCHLATVLNLALAILMRIYIYIYSWTH